jgi:hypothetical protein
MFEISDWLDVRDLIAQPVKRIGKKVTVVHDPPVSAMASPITAAQIVLSSCWPLDGMASFVYHLAAP